MLWQPKDSYAKHAIKPMREKLQAQDGVSYCDKVKGALSSA